MTSYIASLYIGTHHDEPPLRCYPGVRRAERSVAASVPRRIHSDAGRWMTMNAERSAPHPDLKKGSAELLILSLVERGPRHGYELGQLIESRSRGAVRFNVASLYPLLYRLEKRGWLQGRWVEKAGQRRRRYYRLTADGRSVLKSRRRSWSEFVAAVRRIVGPDYA